jgi:hypothetical protein
VKSLFYLLRFVGLFGRHRFLHFLEGFREGIYRETHAFASGNIEVDMAPGAEMQIVFLEGAGGGLDPKRPDFCLSF